MFQVHGHRQLTARNGDLVAGNGEKVAADHPAVLALTDPASVGRFIDEPVSEPVENFEDEQELEDLPDGDVDED